MRALNPTTTRNWILSITGMSLQKDPEFQPRIQQPKPLLQPSHPWLPTQRNCETINEYCFKALNLWPFVTQPQKTSIAWISSIICRANPKKMQPDHLMGDICTGGRCPGHLSPSLWSPTCSQSRATLTQQPSERRKYWQTDQSLLDRPLQSQWPVGISRWCCGLHNFLWI